MIRRVAAPLSSEQAPWIASETAETELARGQLLIEVGMSKPKKSVARDVLIIEDNPKQLDLNQA